MPVDRGGEVRSRAAFVLSERAESGEKVLVEMNLISERTSRCTECVMEVLLRVPLMHRYHRERRRAAAWVCVCVSTCYIIKRGGSERCLACLPHDSHSLRRERERRSAGAPFHNPERLFGDTRTKISNGTLFVLECT